MSKMRINSANPFHHVSRLGWQSCFSEITGQAILQAFCLTHIQAVVFLIKHHIDPGHISGPFQQLPTVHFRDISHDAFTFVLARLITDMNIGSVRRRVCVL